MMMRTAALRRPMLFATLPPRCNVFHLGALWFAAGVLGSFRAWLAWHRGSINLYIVYRYDIEQILFACCFIFHLTVFWFDSGVLGSVGARLAWQRWTCLLFIVIIVFPTLFSSHYYGFAAGVLGSVRARLAWHRWAAMLNAPHSFPRAAAIVAKPHHGGSQSQVGRAHHGPA